MRNEKGQFVKGQPSENPQGLLLGHGWNKGIKCPQISLAKTGKKRPDVVERNKILKKGCSPSEEVREKMRFSHAGEKCHLWRGGVSKENKLIRASFEYRLWRTAVFKRDNYTCVLCRAKSEKGKAVILNADHIKQFAYFPELRFVVDNGRTLCSTCHLATDTFGRKCVDITRTTILI